MNLLDNSRRLFSTFHLLVDSIVDFVIDSTQIHFLTDKVFCQFKCLPLHFKTIHIKEGVYLPSKK